MHRESEPGRSPARLYKTLGQRAQAAESRTHSWSGFWFSTPLHGPNTTATTVARPLAPSAILPPESCGVPLAHLSPGCLHLHLMLQQLGAPPILSDKRIHILVQRTSWTARIVAARSSCKPSSVAIAVSGSRLRAPRARPSTIGLDGSRRKGDTGNRGEHPGWRTGAGRTHSNRKQPDTFVRVSIRPRAARPKKSGEMFSPCRD